MDAGGNYVLQINELDSDRVSLTYVNVAFNDLVVVCLGDGVTIDRGFGVHACNLTDSKGDNVEFFGVGSQ